MFGLIAAYLAVTGLQPHWHSLLARPSPRSSNWGVFGFPLPSFPPLDIVLLLQPVVTGLVLGAPLLAQETESGTARFAWTQGVSKGTLLAAKAVSIAAALAVAAAGLGFEAAWWTGPMPRWQRLDWADWFFSVHPLPYAGWTIFGFSLGVLLGAAARRTVPALVGTLAGYTAVFYLDNWHLRRHYLPPARAAFDWGTSIPPAVFYPRSGLGPVHIASGLSLPDGKPVTAAELAKPNTWLLAHDVRLWVTFQPGSRFVPFQFLEFGYLIVLSGLAVAAAVVLIRRRSA
jgi:hypothetical protein